MKITIKVLLFVCLIVLCAGRVQSKSLNKKVIMQPHLITLDFKKISIKELLEFVADEMDYNIILSENVTGSIALHLKQVTFMQAFNAIIEISGLAKQIENNMIYVGTPANFAERQKNIQQAALVKPIKFMLHHIDASQVANSLKTEGQLLTPIAKITSNPQDNSLWIKESNENLPLILDYIRKLDVPEKQILITAKIVNLDDKQKCQLGIKFNSSTPRANAQRMPSPLSDNQSNSFRFAIMNFSQNQMLTVELDALEKMGHSHVIADPSIVTQNRKTATIEAGEDIPYQEKTSSGATSITFKKAALSLKVTPTLLPDKRIILELEISQNKVLPLSINGTPAIQTQELKTQVTVASDEGVVLGGIYETEHANVTTDMPIINQVPIVKSLIKHKENEQVKKELFILISPRIL